MVQYFGNNPGNFTRMAQAANRESETAGLWIHILSTYFKNYDLFSVDAEVHHPDRTRSDLVVFYGADRSSTAIVVECKARGGETWDRARRQTWDYIVSSIRKRNNPTIGIVAKGNEFIMFRTQGTTHGQGDPQQETIQVGVDHRTGRPVPKGTPSNVVDHAAALEDLLVHIRNDAIRGVYRNQ